MGRIPQDLRSGVNNPPRVADLIVCMLQSFVEFVELAVFTGGSGNKRKWAILGFPIARTIEFPLNISHTSLDTDDMSSTSAVALFSLARPIKALAKRGPATRIEPLIIVIIPRGTMAKIKWSTHVRLWLMNWVANCSPNRARTLSIYAWIRRGYVKGDDDILSVNVILTARDQRRHWKRAPLYHHRL